MFLNTSSFTFAAEDTSASNSIPTRTSAPKFNGHSSLAMPMPIMRSRPAGSAAATICPDFAGMRQRRAQSGMHLNELQRRQGVEPQRSAHEEILEGYGYRQLAQLVFDAPGLAMQSLHGVGKLFAGAMNFRLGPPSAEAASVPSDSPSVDVFVSRFSSDFELSLNAPARKSADMRGMIILIGEDHHDPVIQRLIRKFMLGFDRARGDRFFVEGWEAEQCDERVAYYGMKSGDCRLLEQNSKAFAKLSQRMQEFERGLENYLNFLIEHVPEAAEEAPALHLKDFNAFFRRYAGKLPASRIASFEKMGRRLEALQERFDQETERAMPARDAWMAEVVRNGRTAQGLNYIIVGADHVAGIRDRLNDLPVLRVVPRTLSARFPELKEEL